jgi:hypothetical protein
MNGKANSLKSVFRGCLPRGQHTEQRFSASFFAIKNQKTFAHLIRGPIRTVRIGPRTPMSKSLFASFSSEKEESFLHGKTALKAPNQGS